MCIRDSSHAQGRLRPRQDDAPLCLGDKSVPGSSTRSPNLRRHAQKDLSLIHISEPTRLALI
eukprot:3930308-Alexandrium_andersonii.AAC.1